MLFSSFHSNQQQCSRPTQSQRMNEIKKYENLGIFASTTTPPTTSNIVVRRENLFPFHVDCHRRRFAHTTQHTRNYYYEEKRSDRFDAVVYACRRCLPLPSANVFIPQTKGGRMCEDWIFTSFAQPTPQSCAVECLKRILGE